MKRNYLYTMLLLVLFCFTGCSSDDDDDSDSNSDSEKKKLTQKELVQLIVDSAPPALKASYEMGAEIFNQTLRDRGESTAKISVEGEVLKVAYTLTDVDIFANEILGTGTTLNDDTYTFNAGLHKFETTKDDQGREVIESYAFQSFSMTSQKITAALKAASKSGGTYSVEGATLSDIDGDYGYTVKGTIKMPKESVKVLFTSAVAIAALPTLADPVPIKVTLVMGSLAP